jgi:lactoylglutathione lyase
VVTSIGNVALDVSDLEKSVAFYTDVIGLQVLTTIETDEVREVIVGTRDIGSQLMLARRRGQDSSVNPSGFWKVFIHTDDLEGVLVRARDAGAEVTQEPMVVERFGLTLAFVKDPDGYLIELGQRHTKQVAAS